MPTLQTPSPTRLVGVGVSRLLGPTPYLASEYHSCSTLDVLSSQGSFLANT